VCACCGQEHGGHRIPDTVYSSDDGIFGPLKDIGLVLIPGEPIRVCDKCAPVLRKGLRPKTALRFPPPDERFLSLTALEYRLMAPIATLISLYKLPGEGQYASTGGSISFVNEPLRVALRLPRPLRENGSVWVRNTKTSNSQVTTEVEIRPTLMKSVLVEVIEQQHPAFPGLELDSAVLTELESANIDDVVLSPPTDVPEQALQDAEQKEDRERNGLYGADAAHALMLEVPAEVNKEDFLRSLFSNAPPNVPGEAEAVPGDPNMVTRDMLQPRFPASAVVDEAALGRAIYMRIFVKHFTNGQGGWEQAPEELTELEFIECCAFWHTRQFQRDHEFCAFACERLLS